MSDSYVDCGGSVCDHLVLYLLAVVTNTTNGYFQLKEMKILGTKHSGKYWFTC